MLLASDKVDKQIEEIGLIVNYLKDNSDAFNYIEKEQIINSLKYENYTEWGKHNHICMQIYDELGLLPDSINPYKAFAELINETFNIKDKNIVEIGGGNIPRLAKRINKMQDTGTITVYDPNLYISENKIDNLKLVKRRFSSVTNVSGADLLIGLLPCGSSSIIVKAATRYNKDFMITLCDSHNTLECLDGVEEDLEWPINFIENTRCIVEENNMGKLKVKSLNEIGDNYPIIYNDRG